MGSSQRRCRIISAVLAVIKDINLSLSESLCQITIALRSYAYCNPSSEAQRKWSKINKQLYGHYEGLSEIKALSGDHAFQQRGVFKGFVEDGTATGLGGVIQGYPGFSGAQVDTFPK